MKMSILFGSIFVLTLLLLIPSIPAIQQKRIEDKAYSDFIDEINSLSEVKYPNLYSLIKFVLNFRFFRSAILCGIALHFDSWSDELYHPLLFIRGYWLCESTEVVKEKIEKLSQLFGWGWFEE